MSSQKRKSSATAAAESPRKVAAVERDDRPTPVARAAVPSDEEESGVPISYAAMSAQQRYMNSAYSVPAPKSRVGLVGMPSYVDDEPTPTQLAFVNTGLARWRDVRKAWVGRTSSKSAASSDDAAAAPAAASGKTQLPHALSEHAQSKVLSAPSRDSDSSAGSSSDEFVAAASDDDSTASYDINADVPRIIQARETYSVFEPRVKLSHMVDILNVVWEEESDD